MVCPKCNERTLTSVSVKGESREGYLCENCEVVWYVSRGVGIVSGVSVHTINNSLDLTYTIKERPSPDNEDISVKKNPDNVDTWHERYIR